MSEEKKVRELWVAINEPPNKSMNNRHNLYTASDVPSDRGWPKFIAEYDYLKMCEAVVALNTELRKHLRGEDTEYEGVIHDSGEPQFVTCNTSLDALKTHAEQIKRAKEALQQN